MPRPRLAVHGFIAGALLVVSGCDRQETSPGTITADEAQQLNDAAIMLDQNSVDLDDVTNVTDAMRDSNPIRDQNQGEPSQ